MTVLARIDTPWATSIEDTEPFDDRAWHPQLILDPLGQDADGQPYPWVDVTGQDPHIDPISGQTVVGGNYPASDPNNAKSGDPDYLVIEMQLPDRAAAEAIDADPRFHVWEDITLESQGQAEQSWSDSWDYSSGNGPNVPAQGEMYWRTNQDTLRIHKSSLSGDMSELLSELVGGDRIAVNSEEVWELRGQVRDQGSYIEWDVADLQRGPTGIELTPGVYVFQFLVGGEWRRPGKRPPAVEWRDLLAKFEARGYPPGWIDQNFGTNRQRLRLEHESTMRQALVEAQL